MKQRGNWLGLLPVEESRGFEDRPSDNGERRVSSDGTHDAMPLFPPEFRFGGGRFFFRSGVWYRARGTQFVVVTPPAGIRLGLLPPVYSITWVGGVPYYYANGIYYTSVPNSSDYVVVNPPIGYEAAAPQPPPAPASAPTPATPVSPHSTPAMVPPQALFIYPREEQTQSEITADRSECNVRATSLTGYDPAHPGTGRLQRASDFQRANRTCLEGRGY